MAGFWCLVFDFVVRPWLSGLYLSLRVPFSAALDFRKRNFIPQKALNFTNLKKYRWNFIPTPVQHYTGNAFCGTQIDYLYGRRFSCWLLVDWKVRQPHMMRQVLSRMLKETSTMAIEWYAKSHNSKIRNKFMKMHYAVFVLQNNLSNFLSWTFIEHTRK